MQRKAVIISPLNRFFSVKICGARWQTTSPNSLRKESIPTRSVIWNRRVPSLSRTEHLFHDRRVTDSIPVPGPPSRFSDLHNCVVRLRTPNGRSDVPFPKQTASGLPGRIRKSIPVTITAHLPILGFTYNFKLLTNNFTFS